MEITSTVGNTDVNRNETNRSRLALAPLSPTVSGAASLKSMEPLEPRILDLSALEAVGAPNSAASSDTDGLSEHGGVAEEEEEEEKRNSADSMIRRSNIDLTQLAFQGTGESLNSFQHEPKQASLLARSSSMKIHPTGPEDDPLSFSMTMSNQKLYESMSKGVMPHGSGMYAELPEPSPSRQDFIKETLVNWLDSDALTAFMTFLTIYALFGDDLRVLAFEKNADFAFTVISSVAFFAFSLEIILSCCVKPGYLPQIRHWKSWYMELGSFYFWLDLMATVSLVFEIEWIIDSSDGITQSEVGLHDAGQASRAGATAGRVFRIVRMMRLIRLVRLYKYVRGFAIHHAGDEHHHSHHHHHHHHHHKLKDEKEADKEDTQDIDEMPSESHAGAAISDLTTRRTILGVLGMLVVIPLLTFTEYDQSAAFGVEIISGFAVKAHNDPVTWGPGLAECLDYFINTTDHLLRLNVGELQVVDEPIGALRTSEMVEFTTTEVIDGNDFSTSAILSIRHKVRMAALLNMCLTFFIVLLLGFGVRTLTSDVNRLVLIPIAKVVQLVRDISKNPLSFNGHDDEEEGVFQDGMETTLLRQAITKIAGLMRVGFGQAGASIIAKNLQESSNNKLNLLTSGTPITSIFGFCDIRNFTDTTECLQEEVMLFVNRIAAILHSLVVQCGGSANKNVGDAFLLTWKLDGHSDEGITNLADQALLCFLKMMTESERRQNELMQFSMTATTRLIDRMPHYKVRMGFGLHAGWAIEGAIGSDKKIDASYISPHVNMSEFLESSTKQYGVPLLMSDAFFDLLSAPARRYCRMIDRIKKSKDEEPMSLYTYDCDLSQNFGGGSRSCPLFSQHISRGSTDMESDDLARIIVPVRNMRHRRASNMVVNGPERRGSQRSAKEGAPQPQGNRRGSGNSESNPAGHLKRASLKIIQQRRSTQGTAARERVATAIQQGDPLKQAMEKRKLHQHRTSMRSEGGGAPKDQQSNSNSKKVVPDIEEGMRGGAGSRRQHGGSTRWKAASGVRTILDAMQQDESDDDDDTKSPLEVHLSPYTRVLWEVDIDLRKLRFQPGETFLQQWNEALELFLQGRWKGTVEVLKELTKRKGKPDGPSEFLLGYIAECGGVPPSDWRGYRDLSQE